MDIVKLITEKETAKSDFEKLKYKIIDLNHEIDIFCESKIGYVVEQFGDIFYIKKYHNGIFLGQRITRENNRINTHKSTFEMLYPDKCRFMGKGELIGNQIKF